MDDVTKILENNSRYLDIAKKITYSLDNICIQNGEEYSGIEVIGGIALGTYVFLNSISKVVGVDVKDLYNEINKWTNIANQYYNKNEVQEEKGIPRSEDQVVGETT